MAWLRLWEDLPTDPKFRTISKISKQSLSEVISIYILLLVDASKNKPRGNVNLQAEDISSALDIEVLKIEEILKAMEGRVILNGYLTGWENRQFEKEDAVNKGSKPVKQRVKEYRERQKRMLECNENVTDCNGLKRIVTECNAPDTDTDTDTEKTSLSGKPDDESILDKKNQKRFELIRAAEEVLNFLNAKTGKKFRPFDGKGKITSSLKVIMSRIEGGATVQDCKCVIGRQFLQWKDKKEMRPFLRPKTLFGETNFEQYLGELVEEIDENVPAG